MKINKRSIRKSAIAAVATVLLGIASSCTDLWSEQHPGTFYISDGKTIATFLEEYRDADGQNPFSDFIYLLKKDVILNGKNKGNYWGELKTYGDRTLFVPTNEALKTYLEERMAMEPDNELKQKYFANIQCLPDSIVDSIRKTHLCKESMFLDDLRQTKNNILPFSNMLNRYLSYEAIEDYLDGDSSNPMVSYTINHFSKIIEADDSTVNGVIHVIDAVIKQSTDRIPGYLRVNNSKAWKSHKATIFLQALEHTQLSDVLDLYKDVNYPEPEYDSTFAYLEMTGRAKVEYETGNENFGNNQQQRVIWPDERLYKYTLFAVTDSVLENVYGIKDVDDLRNFAKSVYTENVNAPDNDPTSPLYKLMSYHILPCWLNRNLLNFTDPNIIENYKAACPDSIDMEDFYETMQRSIMRISTPYDKGSGNNGKYVYINRKGTASAGNLTPGIRIWNKDEMPDIDTENALNGGYYFVDSLLLFDDNTIRALTTRIRIAGNTLSPDFINSGARGRMRQTLGDKPTTFSVYTYKDGYCTNVRASEQTLYAVRYQDKNWDIMYNDEMNIKGRFDIMFRLPPVPYPSTYEIRLFINCQSTTDKKLRDTRGIVQFYTYDSDPGVSSDAWQSWAWQPCDIPVDMSVSPTDAKFGMIMDSKITGSDAEEKEFNIQENDKAIRNRGYMKAPAGYSVGSTGRLRHHDICFRKIVTRIDMDPGRDYYLRMRQVKESDESIAPMNILELVPKEIYANDLMPEDRY